MPMADRGTRYLRVLTSLFRPGTADTPRTRRKDDKIGKEFDYSRLFSLLFIPVAVSLATRRLRGLGGGYGRWPTAGEAGNEERASEWVAGPARRFERGKKRAKLVRMFRKEPHFCAIKLAPMRSLETAHIHLLYLWPRPAPAARPPPRISPAFFLTPQPSSLPSSPFLLPLSHLPRPYFSIHASRYSNRFATARGRPRPTSQLLESFHACRSGTPGHRPPVEL